MDSYTYRVSYGSLFTQPRENNASLETAGDTNFNQAHDIAITNYPRTLEARSMQTKMMPTMYMNSSSTGMEGVGGMGEADASAGAGADVVMLVGLSHIVFLSLNIANVANFPSRSIWNGPAEGWSSDHGPTTEWD